MTASKRRWWLAVLLVAVAVSPFGVAYAENEWWVGSELDRLGVALPAQTSVITGRIGTAEDRRCAAVVARQLATGLRREDLAAYFARSGRSDLRLAWSSPGGFHRWAPIPGVINVDARALPETVHKLLVEFAFLPQGVHRAVLYRVVQLPHRFDPRCW